MKRFRTIRQYKDLRLAVRQTFLSAQNFLVPLFLVEGENIKEEITSMPGYYRYSIDRAEEEIKELISLGLYKILLFVKVPESKKDNSGKEALNPDGLMQKSIERIHTTFPELIIFTDIALDPYSIYGHDGIVENGKVLNDSTVDVLADMALSHARAGASFVAPSDMMDGRIAAIREKLDSNGFSHVGILSYSAKYASAFYGPFRDALDSAPGFGDKKTYQIDYYNEREAIAESLQDAVEGADILMVKPGLAYLDILAKLREVTLLPLAVYQVSGEYAMLKFATSHGAIDEKKAVIETLVSFRRAGADIIATYYAKEAVKWLQEKEQ